MTHRSPDIGDNVGMPSAVRPQGPTSLELMVGGDTYKGVYVPPLAAQVMKELQAEEAARQRAAQKPAADTYVGPKSAPAPRQLSAETRARLDAIAQAPDLDAALDLVRAMPELKAAASGKDTLTAVAKFEVPNKDTKAGQAASAMIIEGKSGAARYFGSDLTLYSNGEGQLTARLDKLFGYSDFSSNRFGIQYDRSERTLRSGLARLLPGSTGSAELARFVPEFTPAGLAKAVRTFLERP